MSKIRRNRNFTFIDRSPLTNKDSSKSNKQGDQQNNYLDVPSNGQDEEIKSGAINGGPSESGSQQLTFEMVKSNFTGSNNVSQKMDSSSLSKKTVDSHGIAKSMQHQANYLVYARNDG